jgi:phenylalanyl-tRNA synthetase beta subunit
MLISYKWLQEFFEEKLPEPQALADILSVRSFEIEGLEEVETEAGEDTIIDVDVLPNRAHDCFCHLGMAREVAAITDLDLKKEELLEKESDFDTKILIESQSDLCMRYVGCEVRNIKLTESPIELKAKMQALGQKSINNLVDITNIVMYELGQPMHAFDVEKIDGEKILIRLAKDAEQITTLDKKEVTLQEGDLLIADSVGALAIAGVKGGNKAEVDQNTTNIFLESANFQSTSVRKTSRRIGISTDSSKRFENGITPELASKAMNRAIELIMQYASTDKTEVSNKVDHYPRKPRNYTTGVSLKEINSLLGTNYSEKEVENALSKQGFVVESVNPQDVVVEEVSGLIDRPYKYGASVLFDAPDAFDCSSLVSYVYSLAGYSIPRMAVDQFVYSQRITQNELKPGDLVFSNTDIEKMKTDYKSIDFLPGTEVEQGVDHVGIFIGDNKIIHATEMNDAGVIEEDLESSERFKNIVGYGRVIKEDKRFTVEVPIERLDIKNGPDLIEEIGRILGYENISEQPIEMNEFDSEMNRDHSVGLLLKKVMTELGFSEILTYSFVDEGTLEPIKPIAQDKTHLRPNLSKGMQGALERNAINADLLGLDQIKLFEIGKVFERKNSEIIESNMMCIGVINKSGIKKPKPAEAIRQAVEKIQEALKIDLKAKISDDTTILEINLEEIISTVENNIFDEYVKLPEIPADTKYQPISQYPFMLRDIAVWVPSSLKSADVVDLIRSVAGDLLVNYKLFDVYEKDDKTSYAHRLVFQSQERTLTDEEAGEIMEKITNKMAENGWEVR